MSRSNTLFNAPKLASVDAMVLTLFQTPLHDSYTEPCPAEVTLCQNLQLTSEI